MKHEHKVKIYFGSIIVSLCLFYFIFEVITIGFYKERVNEYAEELLDSSVGIVRQINSISSEYDRLDIYTPCSEQQLHATRIALWPYHLIKDISYIDNGFIKCTALWGVLPAPFILNVYDRKVKQGELTWYFGAVIDEGIKADALSHGKLLITISPFVFERYLNDENTKGFSAIVGDYTHEIHLFKIGRQAELLEETEHHRQYHIGFVSTKVCNSEYRICVVGGVNYPWVYNGSKLLLLFLVSISIAIGWLFGFIINQRVLHSRTLYSRLVQAIKSDLLYLEYQPIYRLKTGKIIGVEALIRWVDDELGYISPDVFIRIAEENKIIDKISRLVLAKSIVEMLHVAKEYDIFLSINVSSQDLMSDLFMKEVFSFIDNLNIPSGLLVLELTERQSADMNTLQKVIDSYNQKGVLIALDDFGTGYSNLDWISKLKINEIKIDKSLTDSIDTFSINKNLLSGVFEIFKDVSDKIIFEGVETKEQIDYLTKKFPDCGVQGWYYSKAIKVNKVKELLLDN